MSTLQLTILIALAMQIPVAALAMLTEFSQRKKRRARELTGAVEGAPVEAAAEEAEAIGESAEAPAIASNVELLAEATAAELRVAEAPSHEAPLKSEPIEVAEVAPSVEVAPSAPAEEAPPPVIDTPIVGQAPIEPAPPPPATVSAAPEPPRAPVRIGVGLRKTRESFLARIRAAITGSARADEIYEGLEEALIGADVGVDSSLRLVEAVRAKLKNDARPEVIRAALQEEIERVLVAAERPLADSAGAPRVILMAGVNGVGKTTTVAKLAALLKHDRGPVLVAAADTFRAAAIDQLQVWCDRVGVELIRQNPGSDPAAVAFDAVRAAVARHAATVLIDTAGRLQTKVNLMEELKKIARVVGRELPGAPHETWLVLDATTGQNALSQAKLFGEAVALTGVILAKLDSTAKGGVIIGIAERLKLPVRYVGLGENLEDLRPFDAREFAAALFAEGDGASAEVSGSYAA